MRYLAFVVCLLIGVSAAGAPMSAAEQVRYRRLTAQLRCLICQNRSIVNSDAPLAADLRRIVARQVTAGRSDAQIKQYLVDRYGQWVLYDPPFQFSTWLLWLGPFLLLLLGLGIATALTRRRQRPATAPGPALDRARLEAVLAESPPEPEPGRDAASRR